MQPDHDSLWSYLYVFIEGESIFERRLRGPEERATSMASTAMG